MFFYLVIFHHNLEPADFLFYKFRTDAYDRIMRTKTADKVRAVIYLRDINRLDLVGEYLFPFFYKKNQEK